MKHSPGRHRRLRNDDVAAAVKSIIQKGYWVSVGRTLPICIALLYRPLSMPFPHDRQADRLRVSKGLYPPIVSGDGSVH